MDRAPGLRRRAPGLHPPPGQEPDVVLAGLHERIRLFRPLFARIHRSYGYDLLPPVQRDFSEVLSDHGYDLDAAVAAPSRDLTIAEHARDLAGAIRWNLTHLVRGYGLPRASAQPMPPHAPLIRRQG